ncbi:MAG TPA: rRNA maturation RNase YbeY [Gammaproteobacteria bacterium]|nr:rRNA maturation RNase YbeY [Gammaproteobacteria bacterium]
MTAPGVSIDLEDVSHTAGVPSVAEFQRWVEAALAGRREAAELSIRVVDEREGAELNRRYRGKDYATNVLSFPAELPPGVPLPVVGDLVICAPVVTREAAEQGKAPEAHWAHLTVHGCLHLIGYDHEDEAQAAVMESLETAILAGLGFPDPYQTG